MNTREIIDAYGDTLESIAKLWWYTGTPPDHDCSTCSRRHDCPDWLERPFEHHYDCNRYLPTDWVKGGAA